MTDLRILELLTRLTERIIKLEEKIKELEEKLKRRTANYVNRIDF